MSAGAERLPLSVLLIARNEERHLPAWLANVARAAEIVVVDSGSADRTRELAAAAGAKLYEHDFEGFGPQRGFALAQCTQPWVLWLDADERLDDRAWEAVARALGGGRFPKYRIRRAGYFLGRRIRFCGWQSDRVLRLFRREGARFNDRPLHESALVEGEEGMLEGWIHHYSYETWEDCRDKLVRYSEASARLAFERGRRAGALDVLWRPPVRFLRQYLLQLGFLDGGPGLVLCALSAAQVALRDARVWELSRASS